VVRTALRLFRKQGYEATTMDAVADSSGVSKHTLYRRYPSKADLFQAALNLLVSQLLKELKTSQPVNTDPLLALRHGLELTLAFSTSSSAVELFRMCIGAVGRFPEVGAQFSAVEQRILGTLQPLVERAQAEGRLCGGDPRRVTSGLYYALNGEAWLHALTGAGALDNAASPEAFEAAWQAAIRGYGNPTK
jgi:AcrR family transcriptional regulator